MQQVFKASKQEEKTGHYLLVDDVITTGSTLEVCVKELQQNFQEFGLVWLRWRWQIRKQIAKVIERSRDTCYLFSNFLIQMRDMEPIESRSNQGLYYALLILMSIPVLYFIGTGVYKGSDFFRSYSIWTYINTAISIGFIALVAKRRFGILLFLIIPLIISTLYLLINALVYMRFYGYSDMMKTLFDLVKWLR